MMLRHGRPAAWLTAGGLLAVLGLLAAVPAQAQSSLRSRRDFAVGDRPLAVLPADLDGDGLIDLISVNQGTSATVGDVHVLKGFGDGTFRRVATLTPGSRPSGGVLADANNDGRADLVVCNLLSQDVAVSLGDGLGGFAPAIATPVSGSPVGIAAGDWNGDGRLDVATVNGLNNNVSTLLGDGTGAFTNLRQFAVGSGPRQILTADFNKDGHADLAVLNNGSNNVQIWRGDGTGQFSLSSTLGTGSGPAGMAIADINGDTRLDLAVANFNADTVSVFLGNTQGGFGSPSTLGTGFGPRSILFADVNKDGALDMLVTQAKVSGVGETAVLLGSGSGTFGAPTINTTGPSPVAAAAADFNRDGNLDVAVASLTGNVLSILQNTGTGTFLLAGRVTLPSGSFPHGVVMEDFNRDGRRDFATANEVSNNVTICLGDGAGGCASLGSGGNTGITPFAMLAGDFNRDGCPDLVTANNGDGSMSYLQANCSGGFSVTTSVMGCTGPVAVSRGEVSGDINLDLAFVCEEPTVASPMCVRLGTGASGSSAFGAPVCTAVTDAPMGIALGPYNIDALEDAGVTSSSLNRVAIAIADGSGRIVDIPATFAVGPKPKAIVRDDLNGDGFWDLVVTNSGGTTISALLGDGGGIFSVPSIDTVAGQTPTAVAIADFNLDGKQDAAVVNTNSNDVALLLGDGAGRFTHAGHFGVRSVPIAIAAGDLNGDGKPDLAVADNFSDTVSILINQSVPGDPLAGAYVIGQTRTIFVWGIVPGAVYDVIRGQVKSVTQGSSTFDLGPVTCIANDIAETDTASYPDSDVPPPGDAFFYLVRPVIDGVPGQYTVSVPSGKPGVPSSGDCP
jgi:hypothetical protein